MIHGRYALCRKGGAGFKRFIREELKLTIRKPEVSWDLLQQIDLRIGTVERAESFLEAKKPAIKLGSIWPRTRRLKNQRTDNRSLSAGSIVRPTASSCGEFSSKADRAVHERMFGTRSCRE